MVKKYKTTKKLYSRRYRAEHPEKVAEYSKKTVKERSSRNKARKILKEKGVNVAGKEIHHKDGNPKNNAPSNLVVRKKNHGGGRKKPSTRKMGSKKF